VSSSNSVPGQCDAVVMNGEQQVGVMRLPRSRPSDFIDDFNRLYGPVGMRLVALVADGKSVRVSAEGGEAGPSIR